MYFAAVAAGLACAALSTAAGAQEAAQDSRMGSQIAMRSGANQADAQSVIQSWPETTKKAGQNLIEKYGQPDGVTDRMLVWNDRQPWKQVAVFRDPVKHNQPMPHEDYIENTVSFKVPENKVADLAKFDHALVVDQTRVTLASHCDSESSNTLALNLANEIVTGKRDVASAKSLLHSTLMKGVAGKSSPLMDKLQFEPSSSTGEETVPRSEIKKGYWRP